MSRTESRQLLEVGVGRGRLAAGPVSTAKQLAFGALLVATSCAAGSRVGVPQAVSTPTLESFESGDLESLMRSRPRLVDVLDHAAEHRFQVLLSVPNARGDGFERREGFRVDAEYFYPASAIKPCIALAALETVTDLRGRDDSALDAHAIFVSERRRGGASVAMLVGGSLVMSDNDASNDLLDLAGFDGLHERLWRLGFASVRVRNRFGESNVDDVQRAPRVALVAPNDSPSHYDVQIPARNGSFVLERNDVPGLRVGESHVVGGRVVDEPMSFDEKNRISLVDLQALLVTVMRPELRAGDGAPNLGVLERKVMVDALTKLPSSLGLPAATDREHKPLLAGIERVVPRSTLTIASKSGHAYGFVIDNAYVADARSGRAFFLTVVFYANANGRLNDDHYEYELAYPIFAELGELVARSVFSPTVP